MIRAALLLAAGLAVVALCGCGESERQRDAYSYAEYSYKKIGELESRIEALERRLCGGRCP